MKNLTTDEYENLRNRVHASTTQMREPIHKHVPKTKNKFHNKITMFQGIRFDSESEARRYAQLQILEKAGHISDLKTQVKFDLLPDQCVDGKKEKAVRYFADFSYIENGKLIVEDVKSAPTKTKEYIIKRKMVLFFHKVAVREVLMPS